MPAKQISPQDLQATLVAYERQGRSIASAARELGLARATMQHRLRKARAAGLMDRLDVAPAPDADEPIEDLVARKKAAMGRTNEREAWAKLIPVTVRDDKPIGLLLVGDPHVDDDHCDIARLEHDLTTVGKTPGFYAGHIGDLTNNWVGRLARLYAHQSTTFRDGLRLTEWMLGLCPNLFVVGGNHDLWGSGGDLLHFITRQLSTGVMQAHGARLAMRWPSGLEVRLHARHDFPGRSQFSSTHGMKREVLWGHRDHILVAGHTHTDEARLEPSLDGDAHWFFRISGYKLVDDFAKERGFRPQRLAPSTAVVVNPAARTPAELVKPFWDAEAAADYLTFLRASRSSKAKRRRALVAPA